MDHKEKQISDIFKKFNFGKVNEALNELVNLIKKNPNTLEYSFAYGKICSQMNNLDEAERTFIFLLNKNKNSIAYLKNLYVIYLKKNNLVSAENYILKLLKINNTDYDALRDLAYLKFLQKNLIEAKKIFEKIKDKIDNDVFALNIYGLIFYFTNNLSKSITLFEKAIKLEPNYIDTYNNIGKVCFDQENLEMAFNHFKTAYKLNKNLPNTLINLGNVLSLKDKNYNAILAYQKALTSINDAKEKAGILANISIAYSRIKDFDNTIKFYKKAIQDNLNNPSLKLSLSYLYLYKNKYCEAWDLFEERIKNNKFFKNNYKSELISYILKSNQNFTKNDNVLILREQGIGEEILFSSIYGDLINYSNNVLIETDPRLIKIFERSFNKKIFVKDGKFSNNIQSLKKFKSVIFAGSLCKKFRKEIFNFKKEAYLISDIKKDKIINDKFIKNDKIKVGISWKSVVSIYGKLKSLNLHDFKDLFKSNRQIISLQYGDVENELKKMEDKNYKIYSFDEINLFDDIDACMSLLKNLDVFVTVSNSTAHLAASMGVKTILICPKKSSTYFYWSNEKNETPWYQNVTIIQLNDSVRQTISKIDKIINNL